MGTDVAAERRFGARLKRWLRRGPAARAALALAAAALLSGCDEHARLAREHIEDLGMTDVTLGKLTTGYYAFESAQGARRCRGTIDVTLSANVARTLLSARCTGAEERALPESASPTVRNAARLCDLDEPEGCRLLGLAYLRGDGVAADRERGRQLMSRACGASHAGGCAKLASAQPAATGWTR